MKKKKGSDKEIHIRKQVAGGTTGGKDGGGARCGDGRPRGRSGRWRHRCRGGQCRRTRKIDGRRSPESARHETDEHGDQNRSQKSHALGPPDGPNGGAGSETDRQKSRRASGQESSRRLENSRAVERHSFKKEEVSPLTRTCGARPPAGAVHFPSMRLKAFEGLP